MSLPFAVSAVRRRKTHRIVTPVLLLVALTAATGLAIKAQASLDVSSSMRKQIAEGGVTGEELFRDIRLSYKGEPTSGLALVSARIEDGRVTAMAMGQPMPQDVRPDEHLQLGRLGVAYPKGESWLSPDERLPSHTRIPSPVYFSAHALMRELKSGKDVINHMFKPLEFDIQEGVVYLLAVVPVNEAEMEGFETAPLFVTRKKPGR